MKLFWSINLLRCGFSQTLDKFRPTTEAVEGGTPSWIPARPSPCIVLLKLIKVCVKAAPASFWPNRSMADNSSCCGFSASHHNSSPGCTSQYRLLPHWCNRERCLSSMSLGKAVEDFSKEKILSSFGCWCSSEATHNRGVDWMCHSLDLGHFADINIWKEKKQKDHSKGFKRGIVPISPRVTARTLRSFKTVSLYYFCYQMFSEPHWESLQSLHFLNATTLINKEGVLSVPVPQSSICESIYLFFWLSCSHKHIKRCGNMKIISPFGLTFKCSQFSESPEDTGLFLWKCHPNKQL